jgi:hypothetical protein
MDHLTQRDIELIVEALQMAAARHESMGHVTTGRFRWRHDEHARRMRQLQARLGRHAGTVHVIEWERAK